MEIREKNTLMAEFMYVGDVQISDLKYHCSWEQLMRVVARIMREKGWRDGAEPHVRHLADVIPFAYIEDVHEAVYRFCKWWKAQQAQTETASAEPAPNVVELNRFEAFALFKHFSDKKEKAKQDGFEGLAESYSEKAEKWLGIAVKIEQSNADDVNKNLVNI